MGDAVGWFDGMTRTSDVVLAFDMTVMNFCHNVTRDASRHTHTNTLCPELDLEGYT
jgi:hypothetical protein